MKKLLALTLLIPSISLAGNDIEFGKNSDNNLIRTFDNDTYNNPTANGGSSQSYANGGNSNSKVKNSGNSESNSRSNSRSNLRNSGNSLSLSRGGSGGDSDASSRAYGGRSSVGDTSSKSRSKAYSGDSNSSAYTGASTSSVDNVSTGSNNVTIEGDEGDDYNFRRIPANTAYAPSLTVGTCLGSASAGGQGATFGFSMGKTLVDEGCARLREVIFWHKIGEVKIAKDILKQSKFYKEAYKVKQPKVKCRYMEDDSCTKHRYRNR